MTVVLAEPTIFGDIPNLDGASTSADRNLRALLVPMDTGYAFWIEITKFGNSVIISVPKIQAGV
jgi:hypothetical protein